MKSLRFEGSEFEYFKIWIVNIFLIIVTLGFYYPWAKVRNKRYFYSNSTLEDRNFEYHATGKQLFVGYLIAMAIFIAYVVIQKISPVGSVVLFVGFFLAFPWIIWRSLQFNMRMTSFSNVRFSFVGKLSGAYVNFLFLPIAAMSLLYLIIGVVVFVSIMGGSTLMMILTAVLVVACLIFAFFLYAFVKKKSTLYMMDGYRYGQGQFHSSLNVETFAGILAKTIGLAIAVFAAFAAVVFAIGTLVIGAQEMTAIKDVMSNPEAMEGLMSVGLATALGLAYFGLVMASLIVVAFSYTRQRSYILANTTLDEKISFASTLRARPMAWVMITNLLAIIFTLGLAMPWAKVRMARLILSNTQVDTGADFDQYLTQKQDEQSSLGEQIGDAFDIDVGLGI